MALVLALSACAGSSTTSGGDKYKQTWAKSYAATTCAEWRSTMTSQQQWAAAADMLTAARNKDGEKSRMPPDDLITKFQGGVGNACSATSTSNIAEIGAVLYLTERLTFRP